MSSIAFADRALGLAASFLASRCAVRNKLISVSQSCPIDVKFREEFFGRLIPHPLLGGPYVRANCALAVAGATFGGRFVEYESGNLHRRDPVAPVE